MKKYKHIFFDLDRTLWDFEKNSLETLEEIYHIFSLDNYFQSFEEFLKIYRKHNIHLWSEYRKGKITKDFLKVERFVLTLNELNINDKDLANQLAQAYVDLSPKKNNLLPFSREIVEHLHKGYKLHIITNGFKEVQFPKLRNCNLSEYFDVVVTSEEADSQKPQAHIFEYALEKAHASKNESIMIGDDLIADISGAKNFGIDQVFFNPQKVKHKEEITYEIQSLDELKLILNKH